MLKQLQSFIESNDNQFGFKKGVGCSHAIYTARTIVDRCVSMGYTANLCAIDLTKAFDKVNHFAIYIKLMKRYVPVQILEIIENYSRAVVRVLNGEIPGPLNSKLSLV